MKITIKKILVPFLFAMCFSISAFAQINTTATADMSDKAEMNADDKVTTNDYERLLDAYLRVSFREYAYETLELTAEQIKAVDPLYMEYMRDRAELNDKRIKLMEDYNEERMENDRAEDEAEEAAEYVEDYWEINIDEQQLRKETFDRMEDDITYQKAFEFFLLEETIANRVNQETTIEYIPVLVELDSPEMLYYREVDRYNTWMKRNNVNIEGKTSLDHQFTYDGLMKLVRTMDATANAVDGEIENYDTHINTIKTKAATLKEDKYGNEHADAARVAFMTVAALMEKVADLDGVVVADERLKALRTAAEKIDPSMLYLEQSAHAYSFFEEAQQALNNLYTKEMKSVSKMNSSTRDSDRK